LKRCFPEYIAAYGSHLADMQALLICALEDTEASLHLEKVNTTPFDASFIRSLQVTRNQELYVDYKMDDLSKLLNAYQSKHEGGTRPLPTKS